MTVRHLSAAVLRRVLPPAAFAALRRLLVGGRATAAAPATVVSQVECPPAGVRDIDDLHDLDEALARAEAAFAVSDDEGRKVLDGIRYAPADRVHPGHDAALADPYSEEYREAQMCLYRHVSGRPRYEARINEHSEFDLSAACERPFPYMTGSAETVGTQLIEQGLIIRHLPLAPGARVVEFGPGWGNLTLHLAQMGYRVTAVDIEPAFGDLIRDRAARLGVRIDVVEQDMLEFHPSEPYDAAVFFESLHHCPDHVRMLRNLDRIVAPDGLIVFGAEPIGDYRDPWGVRLDGLSVWSMRRYGWLELGFDASYFLRTLLLLGWRPQRHLLPACPGADVVTARRARGVYELHRMTLPPDEDRTWSRAGEDYRLAAGQSRLSCVRDCAVQSIEVCVSNLGSRAAVATLGAAGQERTVRVGEGARRQTIAVPVERWNGEVSVGARPATEGAVDDAALAVHQVRLRETKATV